MSTEPVSDERLRQAVRDVLAEAPGVVPFLPAMALSAATGIDVRYDLYADNSELFARFREGNPGYDVIFPSNDYAERMILAEIVRPRRSERGVSPAALFAEIDRRITPDWLMTVDVGAHRILANHALHCRIPGQLLQSNGLCCMGYGVPAAIGAALARPGAPVAVPVTWEELSGLDAPDAFRLPDMTDRLRAPCPYLDRLDELTGRDT